MEKPLPGFFNQLFKFGCKKYVEFSLFKEWREFFFVQFGNMRGIMDRWLLQNLVLQVRMWISHRLIPNQIIMRYSDCILSFQNSFTSKSDRVVVFWKRGDYFLIGSSSQWLQSIASSRLRRLKLAKHGAWRHTHTADSFDCWKELIGATVSWLNAAETMTQLFK